jgi:ABC-2 type transport system permease protein
MGFIQPKAIYILWLREMKTFIRAKSRVVGNIVTPLFLLGFLGVGLTGASIPGIPIGVGYLQFLVPGMIGLTMIFSSTFAGMSVLWDRQFGFLKEIMVTPVSRVSIVLGRITGGGTTALIQGVAILLIAVILGFRVVGTYSIPVAILFMILISVSFIGLGLAMASRMKDMQGFGLIMNFIMFPLIFLSGAIYPIGNLPDIVKYITYFNPLTYGIDGMRGALIGVSTLPLMVDFGILIVFCVAMVLLGAYLFEKSESV